MIHGDTCYDFKFSKINVLRLWYGNVLFQSLFKGKSWNIFLSRKSKNKNNCCKNYLFTIKNIATVHWTKESAEVNILTFMRFVYICSATTIVVNWMCFLLLQTYLSNPYLVDTCLLCIGRGTIDRKLCNQSLGKIPLTSENYFTKV